MSRAVKVSCSKLSNSFIDISSCHDCRIPLHPTTLTYHSHFPIQPLLLEPEYTIRTAGRLGQLPTKIHSEEEAWMILSSAGQDTTHMAMAEVDTNQASETTGSRGWGEGVAMLSLIMWTDAATFSNCRSKLRSRSDGKQRNRLRQARTGGRRRKIQQHCLSTKHHILVRSDYKIDKW